MKAYFLLLSALAVCGLSLAAMLAKRAAPYEAEMLSADEWVDDRDGEVYDYVKIGSLFWLAENLRYITTGSECYEGVEENCNTYGRLYDFPDSRTACPEGWHLPTPKEWKSLRKAIGSAKANKIIVPGEWKGEAFAEATNELKLGVLPGGRKDEKGPANRASEFGEMGISSSYWLDDGELHWHIRWGKSHIHKHGDISKQGRKFYIRCVCESLSLPLQEK